MDRSIASFKFDEQRSESRVEELEADYWRLYEKLEKCRERVRRGEAP